MYRSYRIGITIKVKIPDTSIPPTVAMPVPTLILAPMPELIAIGSISRTAAGVIPFGVILLMNFLTIGVRNRVAASA